VNRILPFKKESGLFNDKEPGWRGEIDRVGMDFFLTLTGAPPHSQRGLALRVFISKQKQAEADIS
jgi:hypothetical protein